MLAEIAVHTLRRVAHTFFFILIGLYGTCSFAEVTVRGNLQKWSPLIIDVNAPAYTTHERNDELNPFLDIRYEVTFTSPSGNRVKVPGFYAGDGEGGSHGAIWRVRFAPDEIGEWSYAVSIRSGSNIAVELAEDVGIAIANDGDSGTIAITAAESDAPGFLSKGRLAYIGDHYLKFGDGGYWIKTGVNSPENFFAFAGFDNTIDQPGGAGTIGLVDGIHQFAPHLLDWQEGDPEFSNDVTGHSGRAIIGAVNYLAEQGINSIYFLPMNLGGDGRDTFPMVGASGSHFDNTHYDVSKLRQWNMVLEHMQRKGIAVQLVLNETEEGNSYWFDGGNLDIERKLFYRELIARFSYLLALKWNLSEESRYTSDKHKEFAAYIRKLDWAEHPIAVHSHLDRPQNMYDALIGDVLFDASSIQFSPENADDYVETWRRESAAAGWPWVIDMDEVGPGRTGLSDTNIDELRKSVLYPVLFGGGNIEWYFGYHPLPLGGDMRLEDFRTREAMFRYSRYAREFMQRELPYWSMQPSDDLHSESIEHGVQVFTLPGEVYAVYLPQGNLGGTLQVITGDYHLRWFNPLTGQFAGEQTEVSGSSIEHGLPPSTESQDWVVLLRRVQPIEPVPEARPDTEGETPEQTDSTPPALGEAVSIDEPSESGDSTNAVAVQSSAGMIDLRSVLIFALILLFLFYLRRKCLAADKASI